MATSSRALQTYDPFGRRAISAGGTGSIVQQQGGGGGGGGIGDAISKLLGGGGSGGGGGKPMTTVKDGKVYEIINGKYVLQGGPGSSTGGSTGGGGGTGGGGASSLPPGLVNTAQIDPRLNFLADKVQGRINDPQNAKRAIEASGAAIRDLAEGQRSELMARHGAMGTLDSGALESGMEQIDRDVAGRVAGSARDIALDTERQNDSFLLGSTGALSAPGASARADRQQALQAWVEDNANKRAAENQQFARISAILNLLQGGLGSLSGLA